MTPTTPKVEREIDLPLPADEAWELVSEPELLEAWLAPDVDLVAEPGQPLHVRDEDGVERIGVVDDAVPGERLSFTWWPVDDPGRESRVDLVLVGTPLGTRLRVTETLAAGPTALAAWTGRLRACARLGARTPVA